MRDSLAAVAAIFLGLLAPLDHAPTVPSLFGLLLCLTMLCAAATGQVPAVPPLPGDWACERGGRAPCC